jgi:putative endonuclease
MPTDQRRERGALGEQLAAEHLQRRGFTILDRNHRTRHGELDLVAADRHALVFCEVKTRVAGSTTGPAGPLDAIGALKQRRLRALALGWLAANPDRPYRPELRFDAIGVTITPAGELVRLDHVEGAF